jgi:Domain of unknown function (DUF1877)
MGMVLFLRGVSELELDGLRADTGAADDFVYNDDAYESGEQIDFDKAWNALQFMFTNCANESDHPLSLIPLTSERIGTDGGYGAPWVFSSSRVATFNAELMALTDEQIESRYDPAEMAKHDVYLADMFVDEGAEALEYIMQGVPALRALLKRCAEGQFCMVGVIT